MTHSGAASTPGHVAPSAATDEERAHMEATRAALASLAPNPMKPLPWCNIAKEFHFSASHQLAHLAMDQPDHPCARLHGHNYRVIVYLTGTLNPDLGFVRDYGDLAPVKRYIDEYLDHRHLNVQLGGAHNTTAERIAHVLLHVFRDMIPEVTGVTVCETSKTRAEAWARAE